MDTALFHSINDWPDSLSPIFVFFSEATKTREGQILFGIVALGLLGFPKTRKAAVLGILSLALANAVCDVLKAAFQTARPCVELASVHMRVGVLTSSGTASAHAANMASLATVFFRYHRWWGMPWLVVALLTGLARIYVGVHYPYQVVLGWLTGAFCAYLVTETWNAYTQRKTRPSPEEPADHR
jgi:undecaprenyl-diphosphatase